LGGAEVGYLFLALNGYGRLGLGDEESARAPRLIPGLSGVVHVAAGESYSFALTADGGLWRWGGGALSPERAQGAPRLTQVESGLNSDHHVAR